LCQAANVFNYEIGQRDSEWAVPQSIEFLLDPLYSLWCVIFPDKLVV
jgi:hypothetical protein